MTEHKTPEVGASSLAIGSDATISASTAAALAANVSAVSAATHAPEDGGEIGAASRHQVEDAGSFSSSAAADAREIASAAANPWPGHREASTAEPEPRHSEARDAARWRRVVRAADPAAYVAAEEAADAFLSARREHDERWAAHEAGTALEPSLVSMIDRHWSLSEPADAARPPRVSQTVEAADCETAISDTGFETLLSE